MSLFNILYYSFMNYLIFNFTFYISNIILFIIDHFKILDKFKIQQNKIQTTSVIDDTYKNSLYVVLWNSLICIIPGLLFVGAYENAYEGDFTIIKFGFDIMFARILTEILFYTIHRICHLSPFYKYIHKKHHEIITPVGITTLYMTPIDLYIGNILPTYLPLYILHSHPITIKFWIIATTINAVVFAHSGFKKIANSHDYHHSHFNKNFGTDLFMDRLFDTEYEMDN